MNEGADVGAEAPRENSRVLTNAATSAGEPLQIPLRAETTPDVEVHPSVEAQLIARLFEPDPVLLAPTVEQVRRMISTMGAQAAVAELKSVSFKRRQAIKLRVEEPFEHGFVPANWREAEELLRTLLLLVIFGANRSGKTRFAIWAAIRHMIEEPNARVLFLHGTEMLSRDQHQATLFEYLPKAWKRARFKEGKAKISYSPGTGFTDNVIVLPNGSQARFAFYSSNMENIEGPAWTMVNATEFLPLPLLETLVYRLPGAGKRLRILWDFTPKSGITPTMAHVLAGAKTLRSARADLLPLRHQADKEQDWPVGQMPRLQQCMRANARVLYFWSEDNPMGAGLALRSELTGKDTVTIERRAYGFARNVIGPTFPQFRVDNVITVETFQKLWGAGAASTSNVQHPTSNIDPSFSKSDGGSVSLRSAQVRGTATRRLVYDPAPGRNAFLQWWATDEHGRHCLYREWPTWERYGDWAVTAENPNKWNGDPGPAQQNLGFGVTRMKEVILEAEGWVWEPKKKGMGGGSGWGRGDRGAVD
jgi:hypothetical protein